MTIQAAQAGHKKLYHYQNQTFNADYLKDALLGRIYFSNPQHFNDPWDCNPWFDQTQLLDPNYRAKCIDFFSQFPHGTPGEAGSRALRSRLQNEPKLLLQVVSGATDATRHLIAEHWRIYCLTPHWD